MFELLFDRHFAAVFAYVERRVGRERAEEIASETFRVAFQRRAAFVPVYESARPWLFGIASRLVRRAGRAERRQLRALARLGAGDVEPGSDERAIARADAAVEGPALWRALGRLRRDEREVLVLVAWEGLSYQEVSLALGIPVGTVRSRLSRARERMRLLLDADAEGESGSIAVHEEPC